MGRGALERLTESAAHSRSSRVSRAEEEEVAATFFLLSEPAEVGATVDLPSEEAYHALRVLRLGGGAIVAATDGSGGRYRLRLVASGRSCAGEVLERTQEPPAEPTVVVGVGAGRRERFLWCVEKLTELEVAGLTPLLSGRVQAGRALGSDAGRRLMAKARLRATAALKQSRGTHLPAVDAPEEVATWGGRTFAGLSLLLAFPVPGVPALGAVVAALGRPPVGPAGGAFRLAVGPEGGFRTEEEEALVEAGFVPAHLGRRRLRFETAAVAAVCQVRAVFSLGEKALERKPWSS